MRYVYIILSYLIMPFIVIRLIWKSFKTPSYIERLGERFGFFKESTACCIWIHAVSVGETIAAEPLVRSCLNDYPHLPILFTSTTPTGYQLARKTFGNQVLYRYMPYDLPGTIKRFLIRVNPCIVIFIETELWPNLLHACRQRKIPTFLANARLSEQSAKAYRGLGSITREMFDNLNQIAAQAESDAKRFIQLGANKACVSVCGNLKYDMVIPQDILQQGRQLREILGEKRAIWIAASTHPGEEELMLKVYAKLRYQIPNLLLILVPRHPERFSVVEQLCKTFNFSIALRSRVDVILPTTQIYLGDTMGELLLLYAASDFAFVGGSLTKVGGHNLLEPALLSKAVISGPFLFNFSAISDELKANHALLIVNDANELTEGVLKLFHDPNLCEQMGINGRKVVERNRGALAKQLTILKKLMKGRCE